MYTQIRTRYSSYELPHYKVEWVPGGHLFINATWNPTKFFGNHPCSSNSQKILVLTHTDIEPLLVSNTYITGSLDLARRWTTVPAMFSLSA